MTRAEIDRVMASLEALDCSSDAAVDHSVAVMLAFAAELVERGNAFPRHDMYRFLVSSSLRGLSRKIDPAARRGRGRPASPALKEARKLVAAEGLGPTHASRAAHAKLGGGADAMIQSTARSLRRKSGRTKSS